MSDDDLLIKPRVETKRRYSPNRRANFAISVSLFSALFSAWQGWEAHTTRALAQKAQGPYLEVVKEAFETPNSLMMTVHNIGHATAVKIRAENDTYIGDVVTPAENFSKVEHAIRVLGSYAPNLPVGGEERMGADVATQIDSNMNVVEYSSPTRMEVRSVIYYADLEGKPYQLPFRYQVHLATDLNLPTASRCIHSSEEVPAGSIRDLSPASCPSAPR
jgi:hypothetical protein